MRYDPRVKPDPEQWLATEEAERIRLVQTYHKKMRVKLPSQQAHAAIHAIVENQVALGEETPVAETVERLVEEGLDRHEALHAVGSVLTTLLWDLGHGKSRGADPNLSYFEEVRKLTAQKWFEEYGPE